MQAGRELDKQVAVGLGWEVDEHIDIHLKDGAWREIPHFSTEWEGMGVLVEEAARQGFPFQIETRFMDGGLIDYRCLSIGEDRDIVHGFGDTAPKAVCRAFLKAKGIAV
ncbi:hypothetical protein [Brevibacillus sp. HB2.2]|uniref:hypothetical protein n=1 Tax=Brevibacillus sp. HB2.2 TaxID=2738846 RepID=UPI00156B5028|nr:hypothetical protein [Brevibacillus sp. HB2.2]NRS51970.1 hypothetical protein [Brevibacillus sp. HB2.2]